MKTTQTAAALDLLTRQGTAFRSFAELLAECRSGYVPSLYGHSEAERALRDALTAEGCRVYPAEPRPLRRPPVRQPSLARRVELDVAAAPPAPCGTVATVRREVRRLHVLCVACGLDKRPADDAALEDAYRGRACTGGRLHDLRWHPEALCSDGECGSLAAKIC